VAGRHKLTENKTAVNFTEFGKTFKKLHDSWLPAAEAETLRSVSDVSSWVRCER